MHRYEKQIGQVQRSELLYCAIHLWCYTDKIYLLYVNTANQTSLSRSLVTWRNPFLFSSRKSHVNFLAYWFSKWEYYWWNYSTPKLSFFLNHELIIQKQRYFLPLSIFPETLWNLMRHPLEIRLFQHSWHIYHNLTSLKSSTKNTARNVCNSSTYHKQGIADLSRWINQLEFLSTFSRSEILLTTGIPSPRAIKRIFFTDS